MIAKLIVLFFLSPLLLSAYLCPQQNRKDEVQDMRRHEAISYTQFYSSTYFSPIAVTIWFFWSSLQFSAGWTL